MGSNSSEVAVRAAAWSGNSLTDAQVTQLTVYHDWVLAEAVSAGGLGPNEEQRLWSRHLADSLTFGTELDTGLSCIDVGSGIGLPGIPLAIMRPDIRFDLVDRSGRRCDLLRRAILVVGLDNCSVNQRDLAAIDKTYDRLVSRASLPAERLMIHVKRLLVPNGIAILGLSRTTRPGSVPPDLSGLSTSVITIPVDILDSEAYLLRIEAT